MKTSGYLLMFAAGLIICASMPALAASDDLKDGIYQVGTLKPVDSTLKVKVGEMAPDFTLRCCFRRDNIPKGLQSQKECHDLVCPCCMDTGLLGSVAGI